MRREGHLVEANEYGSVSSELSDEMGEGAEGDNWPGVHQHNSTIMAADLIGDVAN